MPFCTQCGHEAGNADAFCAHCGARQTPPGSFQGTESPGPEPSLNNAPLHDPLAGLSSRTAAILCYVPAIGWIAAVIVLAARKFKDDHLIRFHAFQGLYLFAAWLVVDWVVGPIMHFTPGPSRPIELLLHAALLAVSIFMMVKASHDEAYVLPIIGELAQRSATEH